MAFVARHSTARTYTVGPILDASGAAVIDAVVGDLKASKNGGAPAALDGSATLTHRHTGKYSLALTATDHDTVGTLEIIVDDTVNDAPVKEIQVIEEAVYDRDYAASATGNSAGIVALVAKFTGITLLAQWLGAMAGKQTPDSTALTEINATGAGSGTYSGTTDSQEAMQETIAGVKTKTDQLTFTKANELDANIQSINGVEIIGDGDGTPFNVA